MRTTTCSIACAVILALTAPAAGAAGGDQPANEPADPVIEKMEAAATRGDWRGAAATMRDAVARAPGNAEYHNRYAYALRKGPNPDMALVFRHYKEALRIDPDHRGAHEYIGEAYLMVGDLASAKAHLARLDRLCTFGCDEFDALKKAIAGHTAKPGTKSR